jgi:hypothetical protein
MQPHMILTMPFQTTAGTIRRLRISLPLVPDLIDGRKYFLPKTLPAPVGEELRPIARPKIGVATASRGAPVKPPPPQPGPKRTRTPWWAIGTRKPDDPLAHHLRRKNIDQSQYLAAKEYKKFYAATDDQSARAVAKCHAELGHDGAALVHAMLIDGLTAKEAAAARGLTGQQWPQYLARRYFECLGTLAEAMGFDRQKSWPKRSKPSLHADP